MLNSRTRFLVELIEISDNDRMIFLTGFGGGSSFGGSSNFGGGSNFGGNAVDPWQIAQPANMAQISDLQVQCEKDLMRVRVQFDRPFYGMIFSKGHYSNVNCVHVPSGLGQTQVGQGSLSLLKDLLLLIVFFEKNSLGYF